MESVQSSAVPYVNERGIGKTAQYHQSRYTTRKIPSTVHMITYIKTIESDKFWILI